MAVNLNKKVLCFLDEYGTAGAGPFYPGGVIVLARNAGRVDTCFSDLLEPNANEIHATNLDDCYLQGLLERFWTAAPKDRMVLINQKISDQGGGAPVLYARPVIQTVKVGLKQFQRDVLRREKIGNVDVITEVNHHNDHAAFEAVIEPARSQDGRFKRVNRITRLDSAASRLLQLATSWPIPKSGLSARTSTRRAFGSATVSGYPE